MDDLEKKMLSAKGYLEQMRLLVLGAEQSSELNEDELIEVGIKLTDLINEAQKEIDEALAVLKGDRTKLSGSERFSQDETDKKRSRKEEVIAIFVVGHRGFPLKFPENTIPSFRAAIEAGAKGVELDVHLTKDDQVVVIHDPTLRRTTNGQGEVRSHTLAELKRLEAGVRWGLDGVKIPTLSEVLREVDAEMFIVELKTGIQGPYPGIEEKVVNAVISEGKADRVFINSADPSSLRRAKEITSSVKTCLTVDAEPSSSWSAVRSSGADALHFNFRKADEKVVAEAKGECLMVGLWTPNKEDEIRLAAKYGPDWITTSYVDRAVSILRSEKLIRMRSTRGSSTRCVGLADRPASSLLVSQLFLLLALSFFLFLSVSLSLSFFETLADLVSRPRPDHPCGHTRDKSNEGFLRRSSVAPIRDESLKENSQVCHLQHPQLRRNRQQVRSIQGSGIHQRFRRRGTARG